VSALTDEDNVDLQVVLPRGKQLSDDDVYAILRGQAIVAAAEPGDDDLVPDGDDDSDTDVTAEQTGAMIALVPSAKDCARLALVGGESADELHLTLVYLGDATEWDLAGQASLTDMVANWTTGMKAVTANAFGAALWNPTGTKPAVVLNVGGDDLEELQSDVAGLCDEACDGELAEQHEPWSPHVCLAYTNDLSTLGEAVKLVGPITFDRVRVAFAGQYADFPLLNTLEEPVQPTSTASLSVQTLAVTGGTPAAYADVPLPADSPAPTGAAEDGVGGIGDTNLPASPGGMGFSDTTHGWKGILVVEDEQTGDGRMFAGGSLTWAEPPLPLSWQRENLGEHTGSVIAARIDNVWRDPAAPGTIWGSGVFDADGLDGAEALRQVTDKFLQGVSVDVDSVKDADVEMVFPPSDGGDPMEEMFAAPELMIFHNGRIRGATLCALPAFTQARIELTNDTAPVTAALPLDGPGPSGAGNTNGPGPQASVEAGAWDGAGTEALLASTMSLDVARGAYAWVDAGKARSGGVSKLHARFLHHHVDSSGRPTAANVTACSVGVGALLSNPRLAMSMAERRAAYEHLAGHLRDAGLTPQSFTAEGLTDGVRALYASAGNDDLGAPPDEAFEDPGFDGPTPVAITASVDGKWQIIRGHAALFDTCHLSFPNTCVTAPYEESHDYYRLGEVVTASGARLAVGTITLGTGHAPAFGTNAQQAMEHYDNTGSQVAIVASGNDDHGIWVAGVVKPGTSAARVMELSAAKLSGDWRRLGGKLRLVGMLAVNVPGFPVPRVRAQVTDGRQLSLVAAGVLPDASSLQAGLDRVAMRAVAGGLARRIGRDPKTLANELRTRVHGRG
jgi:2'-5' RNA ligase